MGTKRISAFLFLLVFLIEHSAFGATGFSACRLETRYYFINGVSVNADVNRGVSAEALRSLLASGGVITTEQIVPLRNPSDGLFLDVLLELTQQKQAEASASFAAAILTAVSLFTGDPSAAASQADRTLLQAKLSDLFNRIQSAFSQLDTDEATSGMVGTVLEGLLVGNKAIVVAHSQGNMFGNAVLSSIAAHQPAEVAAGLKLVSVATPATSAQDGRYKTAYQDLIINVLSQSQAWLLSDGAPLPPNIDIQNALSNDLTGHGFVEVYVNPALTGAAAVVGMVREAVSSATTPPQQINNGPITATLIWDSLGDVDLHTYEPNGTHVSYLNKQGTVGYLDIDNLEGYGPEHYYSSCQNFSAGTYTFGVNYFRAGAIPMVSHVTVSTPLGSQTAQITLNAAASTGGNDSPILLFAVDVTQNDNGTFNFAVSQLGGT